MFFINRIKWALRKISIPVSFNGLVLDVGSGGKPYPRSDVLLDRITGDKHRNNLALLIDRPMIFGDALNMPFKNKSFDFIVASHILEHMSNPKKFIKELERVGKSGYIETPNMIFERLSPFDIHCLEIACIDNTLHIHKKKFSVEDSFLGTLSFLEKNSDWKKFFYSNPQLFHVRYFWKDKIKYKIYNNKTSCHWIESINAKGTKGFVTDRYLNQFSWREIGLTFLAIIYRIFRRYRFKNFNILSILACPICKRKLIKRNNFYFAMHVIRNFVLIKV